MENQENKPPKAKKSRCQNWLEEEKTLLKNLVHNWVNIIENKNTDTNINKKKKEAWQQICNSFNELGKGPYRTVDKLKSQWTVIKMTAKKRRSDELKSIRKTGGGRRTPVNTTEDDIESWLAPEFYIDTNEFDSDATTQKLEECAVIVEEEVGHKMDNTEIIEHILVEHDVQIHHDIPVSQLSQNSNGQVNQPQQQVQVVDDTLEQVRIPSEKKTPIEKKNSKHKDKSNNKTKSKPDNNMISVTDQAKFQIEELVNYEKQTKGELHKLKIENEKLKREMLIYKREYWRIKCTSIGGQDFPAQEERRLPN